MIMRSLSHQRPPSPTLPPSPEVATGEGSELRPLPCAHVRARGRAREGASGERQRPVAGPRHKGTFPGCGWARCPGPALLRLKRELRRAREQAEGATQSNNYWSSTTYQNNPNNAWNVNFNDGNVNANNKSNNNYVRAVRGGS
jgi:hypothetical protein